MAGRTSGQIERFGQIVGAIAPVGRVAGRRVAEI